MNAITVVSGGPALRRKKRSRCAGSRSRGGARRLPVPAAGSGSHPRRTARAASRNPPGPAYPAAQRVAVDSQLLTDAPARRRDVTRLLLDIEHETDRPLPQLIRILPWCWHDTILRSVRSLHETRGDSFWLS